jgi:hypothetical protein
LFGADFTRVVLVLAAKTYVRFFNRLLNSFVFSSLVVAGVADEIDFLASELRDE